MAPFFGLINAFAGRQGYTFTDTTLMPTAYRAPLDSRNA